MIKGSAGPELGGEGAGAEAADLVAVASDGVGGTSRFEHLARVLGGQRDGKHGRYSSTRTCYPKTYGPWTYDTKVYHQR
jgi:hypothetical protein